MQEGIMQTLSKRGNRMLRRISGIVLPVIIAGLIANCGPRPEPAAPVPAAEPVPTAAEKLEAARAYMSEGRVGDAARLYESVLEENSGSFEANLNLGLALMTMQEGRYENERDYSGARRHFEAARAIDPGDPRPYLYLGTLDFRAENLAGAVANLEKAAALDPGSEDAHKMLGLALVEYGSEDRAREELEKALAINPDDAEANLALGRIYEAGGDYGGARALLERALTENPNLDMATYSLERIYYNLGLFEDAEEACRRFLKHYPDDQQSLETLGNIYRLEERTKDMVDVYARLTRIRPDNTTYWSPLIQYYMDTGDYAMAGKTLRAALKENPYYAYANIRYGQLLMQDGDEAYQSGDGMRALSLYGQAKVHFEKAKVDDRYIQTAFQLIDQVDLRIHKASTR
jgi:tetratricopeptide (TPR) repeat protein